jgi:MFS family permease
VEHIGSDMSTGDVMNTTTHHGGKLRASEGRARDIVLRSFGVAALLVTALIHAKEAGEKLDEVRYLGIGYLLLIAAAGIAAGLLVANDRRGWLLGGLACAATLIGYVLSRTTGLPLSSDDIGNWSESIAIAAGLAEIVVVIGAAIAYLGSTPKQV